MASVWSYSWTTAFVTPAAPTGLVVTADTEAIALVATWNASADTYHYEYLVEAQAGDGDWTEVGRTTSPSFTYYLAPMNVAVRLRVSDSNGSQYSTPTEGGGTLTFGRWAMTHVDGDDGFIHELRYVQPAGVRDMPLDLVRMQPLSGSLEDADTQPPIVVTGQWQGETVSLQVKIAPADRYLIGVFRRAAMQPQGDIALKDPKGNVFIVQLGGMQVQDLGVGAGQDAVSLTAHRLA